MTLEEVTIDESIVRRSYAFERFGAPAAVLDATGVVVETNESWRLFAALNEAMPGTTGPGVSYLAVCDRAAAAGDETARATAAGLRDILQGRRASFELEYSCPSPIEDRWFTLHASNAPVHDGAGIVVFHVNITARKLLEERFAREGGRDPATGLLDTDATFGLIDEHLARAAAQHGQLTLIHLGLTGLDAVHDDLGGPASDELLVQVTGRARRVVRADDHLCRLDDDELVVVSFNVDDETATAIAHRLADVIAAPYQVGANEVTLGVALGIAASTPASTAPTLLRAAVAAAGTVEHRSDRRLVRHEPAVTPLPAERSPPSPRAEDSLSRLDAVVARSNDLAMFFDLDGTIAWASPATRTVFGIDPNELVGRNGLDMVHPDDRARVFAEFTTIMEPGQHVRVDFRVYAGDGSIRWIEETATNLVDDPHVGYIVGNLHDITARKQHEEAIRFQGRLLDAAGQAIVAFDMSGNVMYWNAAATRTYGWSAEEALGRPIGELFKPGKGWTEKGIAVQAQRDQGEPWSGDFWVQRKNGVEIPILVTDTPVYDDDGTQIGTIGVSSDITERKQHEMDLARLSAIVQSSADAMFSTTIDGVVQNWNHAAEVLYGHSADAIIGRNIEVTVPAERIGELQRHIEAVRTGVSVGNLETIRLRADGSRVPVSISISPLLDGMGEVIGASAVIRDISEQVRLRQRLEDDRRRLADAQRTGHLGSFEIDFTDRTVTWSAELHAILGLAPDTPATPETFRERVHPEDLPHVEANLVDAWRGLPDVECTFRIVRPSGEVRWVTVRTALADDPSVTRVSGTLLDITDRKQLELDLSHQANHDALTGLPNRTYLLELLEEAVAGCDPRGPGVGVLLFDVDRFKLINDSLGHDRGDQLLIAMADALRASLATGEIVARFGSDTFAVVGSDLAVPLRALELVERIRVRFADGLTVGDDRHTPTMSVGIVIAAPGDTAIDALRDADTAMYRAKDRGRNRAEWFDPSLRRAVVASFEVERELRYAIDHDQLHLVYQPILDLETNEFAGCEALVRWQHPERGPLAPDDFIPIAENTGLIVPLGTWVLRHALATVAGWPEHLHIAVNISPRELAEPDLFAIVRDTLAENGVAASRLVLEITENAVLQDPTAAARTISALRTLGVQVVIDDFGTGYTSLSYLRDYRLDGLKIDRSFITDLDHGDTAIVDAIIRMSGALGLTVVAEGIETEQQLETLRDLGCRYIQGYLISRPVAPDALPFMQATGADHQD